MSFVRSAQLTLADPLLTLPGFKGLLPHYTCLFKHVDGDKLDLQIHYFKKKKSMTMEIQRRDVVNTLSRIKSLSSRPTIQRKINPMTLFQK